MLTLPTIKNLASFEVDIRDISTNFEDKRPFYESTKGEFRKWCSSTDTNWTFYGAFEGLEPGVRVSRENQAHTMHAFVADYDVTIKDNKIIEANLKQHSANGGITPRYLHRTFSGGMRAVWSFEKPITVFTTNVAEELIQELIKHTRAAMLYAGLDNRAIKEAKMFYELGSDWTEYEDIKPIAEATLMRLLADAITRSKKYYTRDGELPKVPLDIVYEELCHRFPGRWQGDFQVNSRGCRFWADDADAMSAIVKPEGMICYTGEKKFVSWSEIFGRQFVEKCLDDKVGIILKGIYTDGKTHFVHEDHLSEYKDYTTEQIRHHLASAHGLIDAKEQNMMLDKLMKMNRVETAVPIVHRPEGLIILNGRRVLNTWKSRVLAPLANEDHYVEPKRDFPFLHKLWFEGGFSPMEQLDYFLAWLKRWYISARDLRPCRGQILIIAGSASAGKTFTSQYVLGSIFGGFQDASKFFTEGGFNGHMFDAPLWCVDDTMVGGTEERRMLYSAMLKKIAADNRFLFDEKFRKGGMVEWNGRVVVTCNDDPESLSAVPQLNVSNDDKVMLLKMSRNDGKFKGVNAEDEVKKELPYFLKWLSQQWVEPPNVVNENPRYGVNPYKHQELFEESGYANDQHAMRELLDVYFTEFFTQSELQKIYCKPSELLERLQSESSPVRAASRTLNMAKINKEMRKLESMQSTLFVRTRVCGNRVFRFERKRFEKVEE